MIVFLLIVLVIYLLIRNSTLKESYYLQHRRGGSIRITTLQQPPAQVPDYRSRNEKVDGVVLGNETTNKIADNTQEVPPTEIT